MLEGSVEQYSISESEKQTSPISMIAGTTALVLILPAVVIALMELFKSMPLRERLEQFSDSIPLKQFPKTISDQILL